MLSIRLVLFFIATTTPCRSFTLQSFVHSTAITKPTTYTTTTYRSTQDDEIELFPFIDNYDDDDDDTCKIGINTVNQCNTIPATQSKLSVATNLAKCICGAGSFALPHVFLEEGVLGGTLAITTCGVLATYTMQSLARSTAIASRSRGAASGGTSGVVAGTGDVTSYVELAEVALNTNVANLVFCLTLAASIGVCSTYLVFIGQTLASLSNDATSVNIIRHYLPDIPTSTWEAGAAVILYPLSLLRSYGIFAFTSALGVFAVLGGILVTLASGIYVDPGGGVQGALQSIGNLPLWPTSLAQAFGGSFGTIAYLFCINFLTFPILNSMKSKEEYGGAVGVAVAGVWLVNVVFAILCLAFYGSETQDLVLGNLDNGPYLSALKLLLCVDLLFTFPIVFSSGRQILENALLGEEDVEEEGSILSLLSADDDNGSSSSPTTLLSLQRAGIVALAITACFTLAQIGGFGAVANLVGGVAQGTLAFIVPPAIAVSLARKNEDVELVGGEICQFLLAGFGVAVVSSVTYFTAVGV